MLTEERLLDPETVAREASERHILQLNEEGLLAEVLGYETREVAVTGAWYRHRHIERPAFY